MLSFLGFKTASRGCLRSELWKGREWKKETDFRGGGSFPSHRRHPHDSWSVTAGVTSLSDRGPVDSETKIEGQDLPLASQTEGGRPELEIFDSAKQQSMAFLQELEFTDKQVSSILARGLSFSNPDEQETARNVAAKFRKHGLSAAETAFQFQHRPKRDLQDPAEIEQLFQVLLSFNIPTRKLPKVVKDGCRRFGASLLQEKLDFLLMMGFTDPGHLASVYPRFLTMSTDLLGENVRVLAQVVGKEVALRVVEKKPALLASATENLIANINFIVEVCGWEAATERILQNPSCLRSSTGSIQAACELLVGTLDFSKEEVRALLLSSDGFPPAKKASQNLQGLVDRFGKDGTKRLILKTPDLFRAAAVVCRTFDAIKTELPEAEVSILLRDNPHLFRLDWECNIKPKLFYLVEEAGLDPFALLKAKSQYFNHSLQEMKANVGGYLEQGYMLTLGTVENTVVSEGRPVVSLKTALNRPFHQD